MDLIKRQIQSTYNLSRCCTHAKIFNASVNKYVLMNSNIELAAGRPLAERGVLRPVGRRLMAAAVLLVAEHLSVYIVTLLADARH